MTDNSASLRRARRLDASTKRRRVAEALGEMEQHGEAITFPAVARRAQVSVSLLYADPAVSSRIAAARDRQRQAGADRAWRRPPHALITEQSLRTELANTKDRARRLAEELALLQGRLSRHLGADADAAREEGHRPLLDGLEERAAELESDNHRQRRRIAELEAEVGELTETLEVARSMNRELMAELNRTGERQH
jgi:uncharacterized coiled-coil protein SlyX